MNIVPLPIGALTSREFNPDTGCARKAAEARPVFITDRGRTVPSLGTRTLRMANFSEGGAAMIEGGCLCGAIRYRAEGEPTASGICHCRTCRRAASAPTLPFVGFLVSGFAIMQREPVSFRSSPHVTRTFCGRCGSPLTYFNEQEPETIDVMTCSLDDPNGLPPRFSVWVGQRLAWDGPAQNLPAYEEGRTSAAN